MKHYCENAQETEKFYFLSIVRVHLFHRSPVGGCDVHLVCLERGHDIVPRTDPLDLDCIR